MKRLIVCAAVLIGCQPPSPPDGPFSQLPSDANVADVTPDGGTYCEEAWSWLIADTDQDYVTVSCVHNISGLAFASSTECQEELNGCAETYPLSDVTPEMCGPVTTQPSQCSVTVGVLRQCFADLAAGYHENVATYDCAFLLGGSDERVIPFPDSCSGLPRPCLSLVGF